MGRSAVVEHELKVSEATRLEPDERWQLARRAVASRHFARSPLLSNFLLYIVAETIQGRPERITEHEIGVHVFDRPACYRTLEDNIVRSYARQLRRRLSDYFLQEGSSEPLKIEIPLGGYIPVFLACRDASSQAVATAHATEHNPVLPLPGNLRPRIGEFTTARSRSWLRWSAWIICYTTIVCAIGWLLGSYEQRDLKRHRTGESARLTAAKPLWDALFNGRSTTYIVPADAGFNIIEDLAHPAFRVGRLPRCRLCEDPAAPSGLA